MWLNYRFQLLALIAIIILSFLLRILYLNVSPPGLTWDEASLGYNAYSILKTGKDEYGNWFPIIFKSFGDYKPGVYVYLTIPFVYFFDLNELSVRLPSIILGSLIPLLGFLIVKEIFGRDKIILAILFTFLLGISPWLVNFSRGAWETNIFLFEVMLGLLLFLKSKEGGKKYLVFSFLVFYLTIFTYQSAKLFTLLFVSVLIIIYRNYVFSKNLRYLTVGLAVILIFLLVLSFKDAEIRSRLVVLNQLSYQRSDKQLLEIRNEGRDNELIFSAFHAENLEYFKTISGRFLNYLSPKFLFLDGPPDSRQGVLKYGVMHLYELPFFLLGMLYLLKNYFDKSKIIFLWVIISIIPAALSRDSLNTVRALPLAIGLELIVAIGFYYFIKNCPRRANDICLPIIALLIVFNLGFFIDRYFVHNPILGSKHWLYGHKEAINFIEHNKNRYEKIIMTTKFNEPYIFYLFYTKYDPYKFQQQAKLVKTRGLDVGEIERIDNIEFRALYWPDDRFVKNRIYLGDWLEIPDQDIDPKESRVLKTIHFLDGTIAFKIAETY